MNTHIDTDQATIEALRVRQASVEAQRKTQQEAIVYAISNDYVVSAHLLEGLTRLDARARVWSLIGSVVSADKPAADLIADARKVATTQLVGFTEPASSSPLANMAAAATTQAWGEVLTVTGY